MEKFKVDLEGEGKIDSVTWERAIVNLPLLRWVTLPHRKVSFTAKDKELAQMNLELTEHPIAAVQNGERIHLVYDSREPAYGGVATVHFYVKSGQVEEDMTKAEPHRIKTIHYSTAQRGDLINNLFDGRQNTPTMALLLPTDDTEESYTPVEVIDLESRKRKITLEQVSDVGLHNHNGMNLIQMSIPATYAYGLVRAGVAGDLERVFEEEDLGKTTDRATFRDAEYKVSTDTTGRIYVAERVGSKAQVA